MKKYPHLRDSDQKLMATIWQSQCGRDKLKTISGFDFLNDFANGKFSSAESIMRCRRKVQEQYPELRGKSYFQRKVKQQEFRHEIRTV